MTRAKADDNTREMEGRVRNRLRARDAQAARKQGAGLLFHDAETAALVVRAVNALRGAAAVPEAGAWDFHELHDLTDEELADVERYGAKVLSHPDTLPSLVAEVKRRRAFSSPSGDARKPVVQRIASLEKQLTGALQALQLSERRRNGASLSGEVNSHEDLELDLVRDHGDSHRMLRCKACQVDGPFAIALSDNGQWNLECVNCCETAAILTEVLAKLR